MKTILSIQSHVAYGYVGNRAATFPLQRLGYDVIALNTVQFSNHTGYGSWTGDVFSADHVRELIEGIEKRTDKIDALLTGYLGNPDIGDILLDSFQRFGCETWLCDPVMGDVGRGFFVQDGIPDFFKDKALAKATHLTPNQFELQELSGITIKTLDDAKNACNTLHEKGVEVILLTSLEHDDLAFDQIQMLVSHKGGQRYVITTPKLDFEHAPNGAGDCTSALFLGHTLAGNSLKQSLEKTAHGIFKIFERTHALGRRELALIAIQEEFFAAQPQFEAKPV